MKTNGVIFFFLLTIPLAVFGYHSLEDPDIGWHLAGGLWMLDHRTLLRVDPFGADGSVWIAYSWLPELILAAVYRSFGFTGLQILQQLLVFAVGWNAVWFFICWSLREATVEEERVRGMFAGVLAGLMGLFFLAPIFHLRPQLLSVVFFSILLRWLVCRKICAVRILILSTLWANSHVFWIFAPLTIFIYESLNGRMRNAVHFALLSALCGLLSPYGADNILLLFTYAFSHGEAYRLIDEFFPLSPDLGLIFVAYLLSLIVLFKSLKSARSLPEVKALLVLSVAFALATALQRKYLPFYCLLWAPLFCEFVKQPAKVPSVSGKGASERTVLILSLLLFGVASAATIEPAPAIPLQQQELLSMLRTLPVTEQGPPQILFQAFDDGGWVAFGLYESGLSGTIRTAIDGRTLVMGQQRLQEYAAVAERKRPACALAEQWGASLAILRKDSGALHDLLLTNPACRDTWTVLSEGAQWSLLKRVPSIISR